MSRRIPFLLTVPADSYGVNLFSSVGKDLGDIRLGNGCQIRS